MAEPIKMKDDELKAVRDIQAKFQEKLVQFGLLYVDKMQVESMVKSVMDRETKLQEEWTSLTKSENEIIDRFVKTYGEGALDLQKGVFIPEEKPPKTS